MANLPPLDHIADLPEDELINPEPAPIILYHAPAQPEGYVGNDDMKDDEEEDLDKELKEEPIEQIVINAYEEVDPLNRPPPASDEETEFAPPIVPIVDADDEPIPPVIQFGHNFHVGESSSTRDLLEGNSEVFSPGPKASDLESVHRRTNKLEKQMFDRYKTERKMAKKFKEDEFRMNRHEYDITALDTAEESPIYTASAPRADDPYVMVRDAVMAAREDDDDDITAPRDPQPSEPRRSPCDSQ
ncbi:hypothetical protein Tco_0953634 [Tanacetum coccineum]|uniref:Uncharacterized protein n=1 Tax=Tanacetum coccineum TaxID=301880 RepID=A0ABQ5E482_9ASTR